VSLQQSFTRPIYYDYEISKKIKKDYHTKEQLPLSKLNFIVNSIVLNDIESII